MKKEKESAITLQGPHGGNQNGSVIIIILPLLTLLTLFLTLSSKKLIVLNEERKQRLQTYQCLKKTMDQMSSLQFFILKTNKTIMGLNSLILANPNPTWAQLKKTIQLSQNSRFLGVWGKLFTSNHCRGLQKKIFSMLNPIVTHGAIPKRTVSGLIELYTHERSFSLISKNRYPFLFFIKGNVQFQPHIKLNDTKEIFLSSMVTF